MKVYFCPLTRYRSGATSPFTYQAWPNCPKPVKRTECGLNSTYFATDATNPGFLFLQQQALFAGRTQYCRCCCNLEINLSVLLKPRYSANCF